MFTQYYSRKYYRSVSGAVAGPRTKSPPQVSASHPRCARTGSSRDTPPWSSGEPMGVQKAGPCERQLCYPVGQHPRPPLANGLEIGRAHV